MLLETLKYESKKVLNLDKEFAWISPSRELVCFYETKETPRMGLVRDLNVLGFSSAESNRECLGRYSSLSINTWKGYSRDLHGL
jgi:hypothetical protein